MLVLGACGTVKPDKVIGSVSLGLTRTELMQRIGPPDRQYQYADRDCFQYALGEESQVPLAVYFDSQGRVATADRAICEGRLQ
jgi:osmotically inducible lipoprotein OsmE